MSSPGSVGGALLLYRRPVSRWFEDASNVAQNLAGFGLSAYPIHDWNTELGFPRRLWRVRFDAIVLHYSLFGGQEHGYPFSPQFERYLDESPDAYKIAFFQDEHHWCRKRFDFLDEHGIDCVFTMLEPEHVPAAYGAHAPGVSKVVSHLPGYVGPELLAEARRFAKPEGKRSIDVGYRGRPSPTYMGRGAQEKVLVGQRFTERAAASGFRLDISVAEEDRLYGEDWPRFLADCRGVLGVESGASFIDLEDEVRTEYESLAAPLGREPTIEELERGALGRWDGNIPYRTISPRHFEAAALGVCQVLFEGRYSGLMEPMRHYIPLEKDFSNFDEVIERFRDADLRAELTANARAELIDSGANTYERFVAEKFDPVLEEAGVARTEDGENGELAGDILRRSRPALALERGRSTLSYHPFWSRALWQVSRPVISSVRSMRRALERRRRSRRGPR